MKKFPVTSKIEKRVRTYWKSGKDLPIYFYLDRNDFKKLLTEVVKQNAGIPLFTEFGPIIVRTKEKTCGSKSEK